MILIDEKLTKLDELSKNANLPERIRNIALYLSEMDENHEIDRILNEINPNGYSLDLICLILVSSKDFLAETAGYDSYNSLLIKFINKQFEML